MKTKNNKIAERNIARRESEIMNILNHTAKFVLYDPTLKTASFTYVDLTKDKSTVFVYVDTYKRNEIDHLVEQLNKSKGVFRSELSKNMKL
jgi:ribosome-binding factor A